MEPPGYFTRSRSRNVSAGVRPQSQNFPGSVPLVNVVSADLDHLHGHESKTMDKQWAQMDVTRVKAPSVRGVGVQSHGKVPHTATATAFHGGSLSATDAASSIHQTGMRRLKIGCEG